mmetsp:Transcript_102937/g.182844  ORF Transcript_102937/g.182844 Transcript_102937/m.182844 type:complete len:380 (+) Transcript_102937:104-1243(+)
MEPRSRSRSKAPEAAPADEKKPEVDSDDEIVHFAWKEGDVLAERYQLQKLLGDGAFGRVLLAKDSEKEVALKVIRDVERYTENAQVEAQILQDLRKADPEETSRCVIMYDTFMHGKHFCMVFELLGDSLYDFLKWNGFRGYWVQDIQGIADQSLKALKFLHDLGLTHTDLKPENIVLQTREPAHVSSFPRWEHQPVSEPYVNLPFMRPASTAIKLIDFGNATYIDMHHSSVINTRQYRAPEVILQVGWGEKSDLWSLGCILMELYTGHVLFDTHASLEHLALIERILDRIPAVMLLRASRKAKSRYINIEAESLWWPDGAEDEESVLHVCRQWQLFHLAPEEHQVFVDFVRILLTIEPSERPDAAEASKHGFLTSKLQE